MVTQRDSCMHIHPHRGPHFQTGLSPPLKEHPHLLLNRCPRPPRLLHGETQQHPNDCSHCETAVQSVHNMHPHIHGLSTCASSQSASRQHPTCADTQIHTQYITGNDRKPFECRCYRTSNYIINQTHTTIKWQQISYVYIHQRIHRFEGK